MPQALTRGAAAPCCTDLSSPQRQELSPELSRGNCQHLLRIRNSEKKRQDGIQNKLKALKPLAPPAVPNWCLAAEELAPSELDAAEIFLTWAHHRPPSLPCSEQHMAATLPWLGSWAGGALTQPHLLPTGVERETETQEWNGLP